MKNLTLVLSRRLRKTPFEERVLRHGVQACTVYNKMVLPSVFESLRADYEHLCEHVQIWDVSCERQVEVAGPDALQLIELVTPRDLSRCEVGQSMYAPLVDEHGGIVNDPVILRLDQQRFWLSIADSDVLLWLKGIAYGQSLRVSVFEPDVSPLALQGPKAEALMCEVMGERARRVGFFRFVQTHIAGIPVVVARSGWSGQGGFEIYLQDSAGGLALWDYIWERGQKHQLRAGCPNQIDRMETGLLSYGSDMTLETNPMECGLDRFFELGKAAEYMSRAALDRIASEGIRRKLVNLRIGGDPLPSLRSTWEVVGMDGQRVGEVTSQAWSPRFATTLCFAMVPVEHAAVGSRLQVKVEGVGRRPAQVAGRDWNL